MRFFSCVCGNRLFFENVQCVGCGARAGFCPVCREITALHPDGGDTWRCGNPACGARLNLCRNYSEHDVCNACVTEEEAADPAKTFCAACRCNETIPDLSVEDNRAKWARLEAAKRRLFCELNMLNLDFGSAADGCAFPLSFDFKADRSSGSGGFREMDEGEVVYTGHDSGKITINIREADDAEREKLRVILGEKHRTLIGHFRHEIAHYFWEKWFGGSPPPECIRLFGDPGNPPYQEALDRYYKSGPPPDWNRRFISTYATMHPFEDWAETFAFYLDMEASLFTARSLHLLEADAPADFDNRLDTMQEMGIRLNEMNRTMGLPDLVPEIVPAPAREKLRFVDRCVRANGAIANVPVA